MSTQVEEAIQAEESQVESKQVEAPQAENGHEMVDDLRKKLESTQMAYINAMMERNFLQRTLADFNFHHNAHDGIVYTDSQDRVVYVNPYFLEMMSINDPTELMNKPLPDYMWGSERDQAPTLFTDVRTHGFVRERELHLFNKNGQAIFAMCSSVASKDDKRDFIGTEMMFCNITSKRKIQAELVERNKQLERLTLFVKSTLDTIAEAISRGSSPSEMRSLVKHLQSELEKVQ